VNRYLFLRHIKGPVIIVVFGVTAMLHTWHILSYGKSWPLYLIVIGLLQLAERAAWARMRGFPPADQPGNWPSSTALSITPPDLPRGTERESGGRE
jgi:hypothetical protein